MVINFHEDQIFMRFSNHRKVNHLHIRTKEYINTLIMVTSQLDAVVTSMNVLNPMEIDDVSHSNVCCDLNIQYMLLSQTVMEV